MLLRSLQSRNWKERHSAVSSPMDRAFGKAPMTIPGTDAVSLTVLPLTATIEAGERILAELAPRQSVVIHGQPVRTEALPVTLGDPSSPTPEQTGNPTAQHSRQFGRREIPLSRTIRPDHRLSSIHLCAALSQRRTTRLKFRPPEGRCAPEEKSFSVSTQTPVRCALMSDLRCGFKAAGHQSAWHAREHTTDSGIGLSCP